MTPSSSSIREYGEYVACGLFPGSLETDSSRCLFGLGMSFQVGFVRYQSVDCDGSWDLPSYEISDPNDSASSGLPGASRLDTHGCTESVVGAELDPSGSVLTFALTLAVSAVFATAGLFIVVALLLVAEPTKQLLDNLPYQQSSV